MTTLSDIQRGALGLATTDSPTFAGLGIDSAGVDGQWTTAGLTIYSNGVTPQHDGLLHVMSGSAGAVTPSVAADELVVEGPGTGAGGISILNADANDCNIFFGCPSDAIAAMIQWNFNSKVMSYGTRTASGKLKFHVEDESYRGEWTTTGLTCFASGVTAQHDGVLHVMSGSAGTVTASSEADEAVIESAGNSGLTILSPDASQSLLYFGSPSDNRALTLQWSYSELLARFGTDVAGGKLSFLVGAGQSSGEWNTTGLTCFASGVTPQHDAVLHVMTASAGAVTSDSPTAAVFEGSHSGGRIALLGTDANNVSIQFGSPSSAAYSDIYTNYNSSLLAIRTLKVGGNITIATGNGTTALTLSSSQNATFAGSVSKASGSFNIEHPHPAKKATHRLVHSFVEGPRADLIYRGVVALTNGAATVDLDESSSMTSGTWVLLCRDPIAMVTSNDWVQVKASVSGSTLTITAQDATYSGNVTWIVIAERHDEHMCDNKTDWTDVEGRVIVEPVMTADQLEAYQKRHGLWVEPEVDKREVN